MPDHAQAQVPAVRSPFAFAPSLCGKQPADSGGQTAVALDHDRGYCAVDGHHPVVLAARTRPEVGSVPSPVSDLPSPRRFGVNCACSSGAVIATASLFAVVPRDVLFGPTPSRRFWRSRCPCGGSRHGSPGGDDLAHQCAAAGCGRFQAMGAGLLGWVSGCDARGMPAWARVFNGALGCRQRLGGGWAYLAAGGSTQQPATLHGAAAWPPRLGFPLLAADVCQALVNAVPDRRDHEGVAEASPAPDGKGSVCWSPARSYVAGICFLLIVPVVPRGVGLASSNRRSFFRSWRPLDRAFHAAQEHAREQSPRPAGGCTRTQDPAKFLQPAAGRRTLAARTLNTWAWPGGGARFRRAQCCDLGHLRTVGDGPSARATR